MSVLLHRRRDGTTAVTEVAGDRLRIGRGTNAELRFEDASVALQHAVAERRGDSWELTDQGSVTGTWLGGDRVEHARLQAGDVIEIGDHRVEVLEAGAVLELEVETTEDRAAAAGPAVPRQGEAARGTARRPAAPAEPQRRDYAAAYRLGRGLSSKAFLSLVAFLVALAGVGWVVASERTPTFRPGPVAEAHAQAIGAAACLECHQPWRGPADALCADCHRDHPVHQPTQATTPPCGGCHAEHRGRLRLQEVGDAPCVACHGDLRVRPGAERRFARNITGFAEDHPEFALTVATEEGVRRWALDDPRARQADPATLKLDHEKHLEANLLSPEGRVQLVCADCHRAGGPDGQMKPVEFEAHCQRCHQLGFDVRRPEARAPHAAPEQVRTFLLGTFSRAPELDRLTPRELERRVLRDPAFRRRLEPSPGVVEQAGRAERFLFESACATCHAVDLAASPPAVAPPAVPRDWLPHARFPHERHGAAQGLECVDCHGGARESTETAEVLLPSIEVCRECHGAGGGGPGTRVAATGGERVPSDCTDCHGYHRGALGTEGTETEKEEKDRVEGDEEGRVAASGWSPSGWTKGGEGAG